jgi:hypothetical protein
LCPPIQPRTPLHVLPVLSVPPAYPALSVLPALPVLSILPYPAILGWNCPPF